MTAEIQQEIDSLLTGSYEDNLDGGISGAADRTAEVRLALQRIMKASRQEERIAIVLEEFLKDRELAIALLVEYQRDRAKFANWALAQIRNRLLGSLHGPAHDALLVADLVVALYKQVFPFNRGPLLLYLSKHLGKYPVINGALTACLKGTSSMFVEFYRHEIDEILAGH